MSKVRIGGLVAVAGRVRRELAGPVTASRTEALRQHVELTVAQVWAIVRRHGATPAALPPPSRNAFEFLAGLTWDRPTAISGSTTSPAAAPAAPTHEMRDLPPAPPRIAPDGPSHVPPPGSSGEPARDAPPSGRMSWPGLGSYVQNVMRRLAADSRPPAVEEVRDSLSRMSRRMEMRLERDRLTAAALTPAARALRGWVALFSRPEKLAAYVTAARAAGEALEAEASLPPPPGAARRRWKPPAHVQFKPMRGMFKARAARPGFVVEMPTPMIAFGADEFRAVARMLVRRDPSARRVVLAAMTAEPFQALQDELEALGGAAEEAAGAHHDLAASFDRVNAAFFDSAMPRPRLVWSRAPTRRKFGHYAWIPDTLMVSRTLDAANVPRFVVDFIMYHELLHKRHGLRWSNNRGYAHTAAFYADEARFPQRAEAEAVIERLARRR